MILIKTATNADWDVWLALRISLWPLDYCSREKHEKQMQQILDDANKVALIAFVSDNPAGLAECSIHAYADGCKTSNVGYLEGWYVDEKYRKQGVGRALVDAAKDWAKKMGCTEMASDCDLKNTVSRAAHAGVEFTEYSHLVHFVMKLEE